MSVQPPPIYDPISKIDEQGKTDGKIGLPWILFFNQVFSGDAGTAWTPAFTSLTVTGTPTFTGTLYKISSSLIFFTAVITPATNTSSTAQTTYINNFPLTIRKDGGCLAVGNSSGGVGMAVASTKRIYTPAWTNVTTPVTISGLIEAS